MRSPQQERDTEGNEQDGDGKQTVFINPTAPLSDDINNGFDLRSRSREEIINPDESHEYDPT